MTTPLYILDTNILVHFVRGDATWAKVRAGHDPLGVSPKPLISVVTQGELRSLARQWNWQKAKIQQMEFCLGYFDESSISNPKIVEAYATIDSYFQVRGIKLGKNDLWIAATAAVTGAIVLTTDHDFDPLHGLFVTREWIDPSSP